ncbi:DUF6979 family protein [Citrobacter sp. Marseille-Q6884]|uniref:DUF6979 family protein n=1 Tax=Citrobacter sp. Marseille-Q6884 TaxID=2956786 RepID=UPI0021B19804|nr:hypothetical protein [Citrobacter sp. Marseille-Q6884]
MTKYTDAALLTADRCLGMDKPDVKRVWAYTIQELNAYDEGCPRNAFIGLCEEGMVKGIPSGCYGLRKDNKNKGYAVAAANLILSGHEVDNNAIWQQVTSGYVQPHDQVNIVIALHDAGLLQHGSMAEK